MTTIQIKEQTSDFAEDKDAAARIREETVRPAIAAGDRVTLDFTGVTLVTQSFIHALISDILRSEGEPALKKLTFKGCAPGVRGIIETVVQYTLETIDED